jgi:hypothetical protein
MASKLMAVFREWLNDVRTARAMRGYGSVFKGHFKWERGRFVGVVRDPYLGHDDERLMKHPVEVVALRDGIEIGRTDQFERQGNSWLFEIDAGSFPDSRALAREIVQSRITVFAVTPVARHQLFVDGPTQLQLIKEME